MLDLHLRHGLTPAEIADELGVTANSAHQVLHRLRRRLGDAVRACVLWRGGMPACPVLGSALAEAGVESFGREAVVVTAAHAEGCAACRERQRTRLAPEALFAAAPLAAVPVSLRDAAWSGLRAEGVPLGVRVDGPPGASEASPRGTDPDGGGDGSRPGPGESDGSRRRHPARRPAAVALADAAVVALVVGVAVRSGGDGAEPVAVARSTASTGSPSSPPGSSAPLPAPGPTTTTTGGPAGDQGSVPQPPLVADPPPGPTTTVVVEPDPPPDPPPPPPPPPPAPEVISFTATRVPGPGCATPSARVALNWRTTGGHERRITGPGAPPGDLPEAGTGTACAPGPATYLLTVTGPGGTATRPAVVG